MQVWGTNVSPVVLLLHPGWVVVLVLDLVGGRGQGWWFVGVAHDGQFARASGAATWARAKKRSRAGGMNRKNVLHSAFLLWGIGRPGCSATAGRRSGHEIRRRQSSTWSKLPF